MGPGQRQGVYRVVHDFPNSAILIYRWLCAEVVGNRRRSPEIDANCRKSIEILTFEVSMKYTLEAQSVILATLNLPSKASTDTFSSPRSINPATRKDDHRVQMLPWVNHKAHRDHPPDQGRIHEVDARGSSSLVYRH